MEDVNIEVPKFKWIFLGDQGTGKSSILNRFVNDKFDSNYQATIGLDFNSKNIKIDNQDVRLLIYDTAGQEKFRSLIPMYTRDAQIILFVYDITRRDSFTNIPVWWNEWNNIAKESVIFVLIGNKNDWESERKVSREEGEKFAMDNNYLFAEVSAKNGSNFTKLFYTDWCEKIVELFRVFEPKEPINDIGKWKIDPLKQQKDGRKGCC